MSSVFIIFFEIKYVADNIEALTKAISKAEVSNKLPNVQIVYFGIESTKRIICLQKISVFALKMCYNTAYRKFIRQYGFSTTLKGKRVDNYAMVC